MAADQARDPADNGPVEGGDNATTAGSGGGTRPDPRPDGGNDADGDRDFPDDLKKLFEVWVDSDLKAQIIVFFNQNPGVMETPAGLARRLGIDLRHLEDEIEDHIRLGLIKERTLGDKKVLVFDRSRKADLESFITQKLQEKMEGTDGDS